MKIVKLLLFICLIGLVSFSTIESKKPSIQLALLKYNGGGDWYANPTALINLAGFCNKFLNTNLDLEFATVDVGSVELYNHPFLHMTGHGNVIFSDAEAENLETISLQGDFYTLMIIMEWIHMYDWRCEKFFQN